jgi:hypothetical protein
LYATTLTITAFSRATPSIRITFSMKIKSNTQFNDSNVMLSVTYKPFLLSVVMLNAIMLSVVAPHIERGAEKCSTKVGSGLTGKY